MIWLLLLIVIGLSIVAIKLSLREKSRVQPQTPAIKVYEHFLPRSNDETVRRAQDAFDFLRHEVMEANPFVKNPGIHISDIALTAGLSEGEALMGMCELERHIPTRGRKIGRPPLAHSSGKYWYNGTGKFGNVEIY